MSNEEWWEEWRASLRKRPSELHGILQADNRRGNPVHIRREFASGPPYVPNQRRLNIQEVVPSRA